MEHVINRSEKTVLPPTPGLVVEFQHRPHVIVRPDFTMNEVTERRGPGAVFAVDIERNQIHCLTANWSRLIRSGRATILGDDVRVVINTDA